MQDLASLALLAVTAATAAGRLLLDARHGARTTVETKTTGTDMVTEMDHASEALVAETILAARPDDAFVGEEGTRGAGAAPGQVRWVVDPLDGTTNYLYGFPVWSVSIAAEIDGEVVAGTVHDPVHDETFAAVLGGGATVNGRSLRVGPAADLATALVGTGFSYDAGARGEQAARLTHVLPAVRDIRRGGAASLDLCWVALGRLDAYFERGLQHWDWAAGSLVASEAGAVVAELDDGTRVAAPPGLHEPLARLLASVTTGRGGTGGGGRGAPRAGAPLGGTAPGTGSPGAG